ncbi:hypothetical protein A4X13_0g1353 [Tilletia indica]|uniref:Uncharacterized protein n=1 Tax=Tilletia indica TaxID=43049 RepID=A0A177TDF3_9BASI|nr:hypothetical protein A4X13_0g1353 [Tilletia indica]
MSVSISPGSNASTSRSNKVDDMTDPGFDDNWSIVEHQDKGIGIIISSGPIECFLKQISYNGVPPADFELLKQFAQFTYHCSDTIRKGVRIAIGTLRWADDETSLGKEAQRIASRSLSFFKEVAAHEKASGPGARDLPGTLKNMTLRYMVAEMDNFSYQVQNYGDSMTVYRSQHRLRYQRATSIHSQEQKELASMVKRKLGMVSKIHWIACAPPDTPMTTPSISYPKVTEWCDDALKRIRHSLVRHAEIMLVSFPPIRTLLNFCDFFGAIVSARAHDQRISGNKRAREADDPQSEEGSGPSAPFEAPQAPSPQEQSRTKLYELELRRYRIDFEDNVEELEESNEDAVRNLSSIIDFWILESGNLTRNDLDRSLTCLVTLCSYLKLVEEAAFFGELLAIVYREDLERTPSLQNKIILANALGALSILLGADDRKLEAVRAAEDGIRILSPLLDSNSDQVLAPMAALKVMYAKSLSELTDYYDERFILWGRKAYRVAQEAIDLYLRLVKEDPANPDLMNSLAQAFFVKASAGAHLVKILLSHQGFRKFACIPPLSESSLPACENCELKDTDDKAAHDRIRNLNVETIKLYVAASELSIVIYRQLVQDIPGLYTPLLAEVLLLRAELLDTYTPKSVEAFYEATYIYEELSVTFPNRFDLEVSQAYTCLAKRQRWEHDLPGTVSSYEKVVPCLLRNLEESYLKYSPDEIDKRRSAADVLCVLSSLHVQLERYEDGLAASMSVSEVDNEDRVYRRSNPVGRLGVQGWCKWMLGNSAEEALDDLEAGAKLALQDWENEKNYGMGINPDWKRMRENPLVLAWCGAVQCAEGNDPSALENGETAVQMVREWAGKADVRFLGRHQLEPYHRILPHLLVLLAATMFCAGVNRKASELLEETFKLIKEEEGKVDGSTLKTALLLKARMLEEIKENGKGGNVEEAARIRAEAETVPSKGFLHRLGCSLRGGF